MILGTKIVILSDFRLADAYFYSFPPLYILYK